MSTPWQTMTVAELAADPQLAASLQGEALPAELVELLDQDDALAARVKEAQALLRELPAQLLQASEPTPQAQIERTWENIAQATQAAKVVRMAPRPRARIIRMVSAAAALAAMLIAGVMLFSSDTQTFEATGTSLVTAELPDGSTAVLTPGSALTVEEYEDERRVRLEGEAFFEVVKGSSFSVETAQGTVEVLGTSFNVDALNNSFAVACATGKVRVTRGDDEVLLTPGLQVLAEGSELTPAKEVAVAQIASYREARVSYTDESLGDIGADIGRYYGITTELSAELAQRRLTVELPTDDQAEMLQKLSFLLGLELTVQQGQLRSVK